LSLASSLAASIKNKLGINVELIKGHNGIYQVAVNDNVIYSNQGTCSQRPKEEDILREIQKYKEPIAQKKEIEQSQSIQRNLDIEFMYLDLSVCSWCQSTESNLEEAIAEVAHVLKETGVKVNVSKIHIQSEQQARNLGFISSPTIRISGQDIQLDVKEALCDSCGDLCGDSVDCRIWTYQGKEYTAPPKGMIIDAILREVYGGTKKFADTPSKLTDVPENLKKFFAAKERRDNVSSPEAGSCCSTSNSQKGTGSC
jgi:glutaredoxin